MFDLDDTIAAVSSPAIPNGAAGRTILRLSGAGTYAAAETLLAKPVRFEKNRIIDCKLLIDKDLTIDGKMYCFFGPHSYTGQNLCELHIEASPAAVEALLATLFKKARPAGPGEFTQRAYLNGKLDLTQAEAVAEIVCSANTAQLNAAQQLLGGRFSHTISQLRDRMLDLIGRIEAGLDFSEEDIEFVTKTESLTSVSDFKQQLKSLLDGSIHCERMIDMDAVGLAGLPNAGKSSLLNALLGQARSIVSDQEATTRDVLTGILELNRIDSVLFDCAGLLSADRRRTMVDTLSHNASLEALNHAALVVFCVDITKDDLENEVRMRHQIKAANVLFAATKVDLLPESEISRRLKRLAEIFDSEFTAVSSVSPAGRQELKTRIEERLLSLRSADKEHQDRLTINQRHRRRLEEAVKALNDCAEEIEADSTEIAAMLLRQSFEVLGGLEHENIDEAILDRIFSRFCIGK